MTATEAARLLLLTESTVCLRKDYITSFAELKTVGARSGTATKSQVWMNGQEEPFHVFEDVDTICRLTE